VPRKKPATSSRRGAAGSRRSFEGVAELTEFKVWNVAALILVDELVEAQQGAA
jgi:hypothetical protein